MERARLTLSGFAVLGLGMLSAWALTSDAGGELRSSARAQETAPASAATEATREGPAGESTSDAAGEPAPFFGASARWERDYYARGQHLCFEVRGDRFQLSVWPEGHRHPALVRGRFAVAAPRRGAASDERTLTLRVETITTKSLTRCRRSWEDRAIPAATVLGARLTVGTRLQLRATHLPDERLRLCRGTVCGEMRAVTPRDLED